MAITLVYIPKKFKSFDMVQEDIRKATIVEAQNIINVNEDMYEYEGIPIPDVEISLRNMWQTLLDSGLVIESNTGYYNDDEDFYYCPIMHAMVQLLTELDFRFDHITIHRDTCDCIININSNDYKNKIKVPIEEILK